MKKLLTVLLLAFGSQAVAEKIDVTQFIDQSVEGLKQVTEVHAQTWGLGSEVNWGVDQDSGLIRFNFADGKVATAPAQIIGTYYKGTFMWGWDHPSVKPGLDEAAKKLKSWGTENEQEHLITQKVAISEEEAWAYTALAMRLSEGNGAYRANAGGGTLVYMTFGDVNLAK